jgi:hypothetical protein
MTQQLSTVLAVDLDHTLINTDMIFMGFKIFNISQNIPTTDVNNYIFVQREA